MSEILELTELGNPILREVAKEVGDFADYEVQKLIDDMLVTVVEANGVGLAAPQVNSPLRIFVMASYPNPRYPDAPEIDPYEVINPEIVSKSEETEDDWEGCLSIPGIRGFVPRHKEIEVKYFDRYGREKSEVLKDFLARVFQHEFDHLEGIVFLDRLESSMDIITDREYIKLLEEAKDE